MRHQTRVRVAWVVPVVVPVVALVVVPVALSVGRTVTPAVPVGDA
ncbi:hypothetical protein [Streptomyces acidicola]